MSKKDIMIMMMKKSLDDIIDVPIPQGYTVRNYKKGDKDMWVQLYNQLDEFSTVTAKEFDESFGDDHDKIAKCIFFLCHEGKEIGTVTNWPEPDMNDKKTARLHWIGVESGHRGKRLGGAMLSFALKDMQQQGNEQSILGTMNKRIAALNMYFKFGYEAIVYSDQYSSIKDQTEAWRTLRRKNFKEYKGMINV